jgi:hypothetical protein
VARPRCREPDVVDHGCGLRHPRRVLGRMNPPRDAARASAAPGERRRRSSSDRRGGPRGRCDRGDLGTCSALQSSRLDVAAMLRFGGRSQAGGVIGRRLRTTLVIAEVALAVVLLAGAACSSRASCA